MYDSKVLKWPSMIYYNNSSPTPLATLSHPTFSPVTLTPDENLYWHYATCSVGDLGLLPGLGRSPGEGNGNPLQYSCLENPMDRGAWWATVSRFAESDSTELLT